MSGIMTEGNFKAYLLAESRKRFSIVQHLNEAKAVCSRSVTSLVIEHSKKSDSHATSAKLHEQLVAAEKECSSNVKVGIKLRSDLLD